MDAKQLENFAGPLSHEELDYLEAVQSFVRRYLQESRDFRGLAERLWLEIRRVLVSLQGNMPIAEVIHWNTLSTDPEVDAEHLTDPEKKFLEDVIGFVEYSIQNGLRFQPVFGGLIHDFSELANHNFRLDFARKSGWLPQVTGYASITDDSFGGIDEPTDSQ